MLDHTLYLINYSTANRHASQVTSGYLYQSQTLLSSSWLLFTVEAFPCACEVSFIDDPYPSIYMGVISFVLTF